MEWWQAVILALVQGLTEFLPISSSAHLILPSHLLGWPDQGLAFDVAVHVGTLLAVIWYFRTDIRQLSSGFIKTTFLGKPNADGRLAWYIGLATIPAGLLGLLLNGSVEEYLRDTVVIATTTIFFGYCCFLQMGVTTYKKNSMRCRYHKLYLLVWHKRLL